MSCEKNDDHHHLPGYLNSTDLRSMLVTNHKIATTARHHHHPKGQQRHYERLSDLEDKESKLRQILSIEAGSCDSPLARTKKTTEVVRSSNNNKKGKRRRRRLKQHHLCDKLKQTQENVVAIDESIQRDLRWVRDNVPTNLIRSQTLSKAWGANKLRDSINKIHTSALRASLKQWKTVVSTQVRHERQHAFQKSTVALQLVRRLEALSDSHLQELYERWVQIVRCQRSAEFHAAAVEIQRYFREYMLRDNIKNTIRNNAAVVIQRHARGSLGRAWASEFKIFHTQDVAIRFLQHAFRTRRCRLMFRIVLKANSMNKAAIKIQRMMRQHGSVRMEWMKRRHQMYLERDSSAIITRFFRVVMAKTILHRAREHVVATVLQKWFIRIKRVRRTERLVIDSEIQKALLQISKDVAAIVIQSAFRKSVTRRAYVLRRSQHVSAILIQCMIRVGRAKNELRFRRLRQFFAAIVIQRSMRSYHHRLLLFAALARSLVPMFLKALDYGEVFRQTFEFQIENSAAMAIQQAWYKKCQRVLAQLQLEKVSATVIQAYFRGNVGRRVYLKLRKEREILNAERASAATVLQKMFRCRKARAVVRQMYELACAVRANAAAVKLQQRWKVRKACLLLQVLRREAKAEERRRNAAAVTIQSLKYVVARKRDIRQAHLTHLLEVARAADDAKRAIFAKNVAAKKIQKLGRAFIIKNRQEILIYARRLEVKRKAREKGRHKVVMQFLREKNQSMQEEIELEKTLEEKRLRALAEAKAKKEAKERELKAAQEAANWEEYIDEDSGNPFLYNSLTGETKWQ